jgi:creatinine amidohydrolase/Fe(II)-dependent formamide hydrolase-like protein
VADASVTQLEPYHCGQQLPLVKDKIAATLLRMRYAMQTNVPVLVPCVFLGCLALPEHHHELESTVNCEEQTCIVMLTQ